MICDTYDYAFRDWNRNIPGKLDQYNGCWCPGSLYHQVINGHGFDEAG